MTKTLPESDFILFLRHCCFETIVLRAAPARLMQIEQRNLQALGYFYLAKTLPAEYQKKWGAIYRAQSLHDVQLEYAYRRLQAFFLNQNIRYCPLKGADLSWRRRAARGHVENVGKSRPFAACFLRTFPEVRKIAEVCALICGK